MLRSFIKKEKKLFCIFIASLLTVIVWLILLEIDEIFKYGSEIGTFFSTISFGYIISYIFFYLVVFKKQEADTKNIASYVSMKLTEICIIGFCSYRSLFFKFNTPKKFPPDLDSIVAALKKQDPIYSFVSNNNGNITWYEYLKNINHDYSIIIDQIWSVFPYMETEIVKYLIELKESKLSKCAKYAIIPIESALKKAKFKSWEQDIFEQLFEFYQTIHKLRVYLDNNFKEFEQHKDLRNSRL